MAVLAAQVVADPDRGWLPWMAGLAERARVEERNRIAHEIHDAVAHALTVSLLHISSARLALDEDLDEARTLLAEAEDMGRVALTEVRQAVGMLRRDGWAVLPLHALSSA